MQNIYLTALPYYNIWQYCFTKHVLNWEFWNWPFRKRKTNKLKEGHVRQGVEIGNLKVKKIRFVRYKIFHIIFHWTKIHFSFYSWYLRAKYDLYHNIHIVQVLCNCGISNSCWLYVWIYNTIQKQKSRLKLKAKMSLAALNSFVHRLDYLTWMPSKVSHRIFTISFNKGQFFS